MVLEEIYTGEMEQQQIQSYWFGEKELYIHVHSLVAIIS